MLLQHPQNDALPPDSSKNLRNMAILIAAAAIVGTRSRVGGVLAMAGLAWFSSRKKTLPERATETSARQLQPVIVPPAAPTSLDDFCAPSHPFLDAEPSGDAIAWDELRASLAPPSSFYRPPEKQ